MKKTKLLLTLLITINLISAIAFANCQAGFTWVQTGNNGIKFTNISTGVTATTVYYWSFGDGSTGHTQDPTHTYTIPGKYKVCFNIKDSVTACNSYFCDSITVTGSINCNLTLACHQYHNASCSTCSDGIAYTSASNGTAPYTYSWTNGQTTSFASGLAVGTYTVCVIDANGCTACCSTTITDSVVCKMGLTGSQYHSAGCSTCSNGVGYVTASGGTAPFAYSWNTNPIQTTQGATNLLPGTYLVCATDAKGCSACCSVTITDSTVCNLTVGCYATHHATCSTCSNGAAHAHASNGTQPYTFTWSTNPPQNSEFATGLAPGTYTVCVKDAHNCMACCTTTILDSGTCNVSIKVYQYHNATCATCANGSVYSYASNGTAPYSYSWSTSPVQHTPLATGLLPGTYTVCVTDAHNCNACNSITITDSIRCALNVACYQSHAATCAACADGVAHAYASNGTMPYTYAWSNGAATENASGLSPGTYSVCVTDANGCSACCVTKVSYTNNSCQAYFYLRPDTTAPHTYVGINYSTSSHAPITYSWNWGDGTTSAGAYPSHNYATAGVYNICLSITDAVGCSSNFCRNDSIQRNAAPGVNDIIGVNIISEATGINQVKEQTSFVSIYPMPNNGNFTLSYHLSSAKSTFQVVDLMGRVVYTAPVSGSEGVQNISVSDLNNGIYYWKMSSDKEMLDAGKIVVTK